MSSLAPKPPAFPPPLERLGASVLPGRQPGPEELFELYRLMRTARRIEERVVELYRQNRITGGCYTGIGNEATSVGSAWALGPEDVLVPTHRDLGSHLVRGHDAAEIFRQYMKRASSQTGGRDSGLHMGREGSNIVGMVSHLAHMMPVAVGVALAERQKGSPKAVLTTIGDGASSLGDFHEALNFAAVQRLPVVFVIVNNQYAYSTPNTLQYACARLSDRALGYGMHGEQVDGTDVIAVVDATRRARERGLAGEGPTLIESVTMRMRGHSEHDDYKYVPEGLLAAWERRDPVDRLRAHLLEAGDLPADRLGDLESEVDRQVEAAIATAEAEPGPRGPEATEGVFRHWDERWTPEPGIERWSER